MPDDKAEGKVYELTPTKNALAAVLGGIAVITLTFLTYRYFNKPEQQPEINGGKTTETITNQEEPGASKNGQTMEKTPTSESNKPQVLSSQEISWAATDYKQGDIKASSYTVKAGDTLWEIAEARYGNGAEWTKILSANSGNIGFLPNGSQALIMTGQVLVLP